MADPRVKQRINACPGCYSACLLQTHGSQSLALDG
jgi:hypothetical protein